MIAGGKLHAQYKARGEPGSVTYAGSVLQNGALEVVATGSTGKREFAAGKVAEGSAYSYTLHGKLAETSGQATRKEQRPCTANFSRL